MRRGEVPVCQMGGRLRRCRRQLCPLLALLTCTVLLTIVFYGRDPPRVKARFPIGRPSGVNPYVTTFPRSHGNAPQRSRGSDVKTILLWTGFFGSDTWGTNNSTFALCAVKKCRVTGNKKEAQNADAMMMNIRDFTSVSDLPSSHPPHQVWILHSSEPPYYAYLDLDAFRGVFNWTSWYRSDADIFSPYGSYSPIHPASQRAADDTNRHIRELSPDSPIPTLPNAGDLLPDTANGHDLVPGAIKRHDLKGNGHDLKGKDRDLVSGATKRHERTGNGHDLTGKGRDLTPDAFSQHDLLVFWAASSCLNYDQRYKVVGELQKYLHVDTYGWCGKLTCKAHTEHCRRTMGRYKFVLAFENGYCRDYVTEKYWNALDRFQIPVVMGGADYSRLAVPGSYIDVDNFTSVADLASFILRVGNDRDLYNSFHAWRAVYRVNARPLASWCQICQALHDDSRPAQAYRDLRGWMAEDTCPLHNSFQQFYVWGKTYLLYTLFGI